jgi:hypothetical protein
VLRRVLLGALVVIVVLLVVADRVGAIVAAHVIADRIQTDEHLSSRPAVSVGGFPFLTQAVRGDYSDVTVTLHDFATKSGLTMDTVKVHLHGVHLPLSRAVKSSGVRSIPVDRVDGTALLTYPQLNAYLRPKHLTVGPGAGGTVRVTTQTTVAGARLAVFGTGRAQVSHGVLTVTTSSVGAAAGSHAGSLPAHLSVSFPLAGLPFRLALGRVSATTGGVQATGTATGVVLGSH